MFTFFEKLVDPFPAEVPVCPPRGLFPFLWHFARPVWPHLAVVGVTAGAIAVLEVALFGILGDLIDILTSSDPSTFFAEQFWWLIGASIVLLVLPLVDFVHEATSNQSLMGNLPMRVRWLAHRYILRQSMSFFQDDFAGRVATKVMQTALAVRSVLELAMGVLVYAFVYVVSTLALLSRIDGLLMVPLLGWLAGYGAAMWFFVPRLKDIAKAQSDARSEVTGRIVDSYTNIQTVKLFAHAAREEAFAKESMVGFLGNVYSQFRLVTWLNIVLEGLGSVLVLSLGLVGLWLWSGDLATAGALALSLGLAMRIRAISHWIMWEVAELFENIGTVQDGAELIAREHGLTDRPGAPALAVFEGRIAFEHVRFHYGKSTGVLDDLSLAIAPGEKVGLVGPSGAGKSTVVNLLLRFYDPEAGRIRIDGQDVKGVTQETLRSTIGLVTQDTSLLHRSVRDNVRYGSPDADEAEIRAALAAAKADGFVPDLTDQAGRAGLDAHVGERGVKLSGGQRQRIAIARVILKDAPILVLDEATSALDSEVEAAIQDSLTRLMANKTVIAIAHRLSTIAAMDRLIVMDQGRIVEEGTHADLLQRSGLYARLWARQSGGFLDVGGPVAAGAVGLKASA